MRADNKLSIYITFYIPENTEESDREPNLIDEGEGYTGNKTFQNRTAYFFPFLLNL